MKVLIYGMNFSPELTGIGKYTGEMAESLSLKCGHDVTVIASNPYYPAWEVNSKYNKHWYQSEKKTQINSASLEVIRCPLYVPKKPKIFTRLVHLASFSLSSLPILFSKIFKKPDVIIVIAPSLLCAPAAWLFSKITGAKSILHIQDYEVDAMFKVCMKNPSRLFKVAEALERFILKRFDRVSTISNSMLKLAVKKGVAQEKTILFPNWSNTDTITPDSNHAYFREQWGFSDTDRIILYSGNIARKQGLSIVIDAAQHFHDQPNIKFVIVGEGVDRESIQEQVKEKNLNNIFFKSLVPKNDLSMLLTMADIHLIVQRKGAADIVLPSKLTNILSAGGHILMTATPQTELGILASKYPGIAVCVEPEDVKAFTNGLEDLLQQDTRQTNFIARDYAVKHLNKNSILERFNKELYTICKQKLSHSSTDIGQKDA